MRKVHAKFLGTASLALCTALAVGTASGQAHNRSKAAAGGLDWLSLFGSVTYPIEGTWNVDVAITDCGSGSTIVAFEALAIFAHGGTFHDANATNPALRSPAFGTWRHIRRNRYEFAFRNFRFDVTGENIGSQIVRHEVTLEPDGKSYVSDGTAEFYDTYGALTMTGCSSATAVRFK